MRRHIELARRVLHIRQCGLPVHLALRAALLEREADRILLAAAAAKPGDNEDITVVRKACGHIALAIVTNFINAACQREIDDLVAIGMTVERMPVTTYRSQQLGCACRRFSSTTHGTEHV
jgi:hypothetical protein